jgi:hypothetical protein
MAALGGAAPDIMAQSDVSEFSSSVTLDGEETLAGVPTYVISFDMDIAKYLQKDPSSASIFNPVNTVGNGKLWIDQENSYILKMEMNLAMDLAGNKVSTVTEMSFTDFNQPIEMPQP